MKALKLISIEQFLKKLSIYC